MGDSSSPRREADSEPTVPAERAPYRMWSGLCPFRKSGSPVVGNMGSSVASVVIMRADTFKRLVAENPNLSTAQFELGEL